MSILERHTDRAEALGIRRAEDRLERVPPLPEETMLELWDDISEYDLYQSVTGDKFPVYSTDRDAWDREQLVQAFEDGYYSCYENYTATETYGYRD